MDNNSDYFKRKDLEIKNRFRDNLDRKRTRIAERHSYTHGTLELDLRSRGAHIMTDVDDYETHELKFITATMREENEYLNSLKADKIRANDKLEKNLFFYTAIGKLKDDDLKLSFDNPVLSDFTDSELRAYDKLLTKSKGGDSLLKLLESGDVSPGSDDTVEYILFNLADKARKVAGFDSVDEMMKWIVVEPTTKERAFFIERGNSESASNFHDYIYSINDELKGWDVLGMQDFRPGRQSLETVLKRHFQLFGLNYSIDKKTTGDVRLEVLKDRLVAHYKKYNKDLKPQIKGTLRNKREVALKELRRKMLHGERLSNLETELMGRIGRVFTIKPGRSPVISIVKDFIQRWFNFWKARVSNCRKDAGVQCEGC